ncbi:MAG: hydroxymethylbilane synthase [Campylobacterota bacterium]|nr:hydroxymethylbilane synthase [Campylobacterota bacterium]
MEKIIIATRASDLALWQAYHVKDAIEIKYPNIEVELNKITSKGDKILDKPLALIGGKGHFTKELEDEMLAGNAHLAVHSLKDVPTYMPEGLELSAITKREDQSDVFLSHNYKTLEELPEGAVVGTTSLRRRMQLLSIRPDIKVKDLRGNVNTRLRKLKEGQYDAIILAYIGLHRLDLLKDIPYTQKLSLDLMIPPMGQAALGIQIISSNEKIREIASIVNDPDTFLCTKIERDFISKIGAGCSAPVACNATIDNSIITLRTMIGFPNGTNIVKKSLSKDISKATNIGIELANEMIKNGILEILKDAEKIAFKDEMPQRI